MLKEWGTNIVRLGVIWEAVEKQPGVYDFDYLDKIQDIVDRLGNQGIYTIIDSHQDIFSRALQKQMLLLAKYTCLRSFSCCIRLK